MESKLIPYLLLLSCFLVNCYSNLFSILNMSSLFLVILVKCMMISFQIFLLLVGSVLFIVLVLIKYIFFP